MRLFEHPDFEQAVLRATEHFRSQGLRPAIIEKDYYVTEALRIIAAMAGDKIIFKGGTSLSKGWNPIQRFSEDIDIFLDPLAFQPELRRKGNDRELKNLRDDVAEHPALTYVAEESQTIGGFGRNDRFSYVQRFGGPGEVTNRVLLEAGAASGREPTMIVSLRSYLGQFLEEMGTSLGAGDEGPFSMRLLHFRRTFVEKMFAIHSKIELFKRGGQPIGGYARHYYDLYQLSSQSHVLTMLQSPEYAAIKSDYDQISRTHSNVIAPLTPFRLTARSRCDSPQRKTSRVNRRGGQGRPPCWATHLAPERNYVSQTWRNRFRAPNCLPRQPFPSEDSLTGH